MSLRSVVIDDVEVAVYTVPTNTPEADGTFAWSSTTMVLVSLRAGDVLGIGWTYGAAACAAVVREQLIPVIKGRDAFDIGGAWSSMVGELRNVGRPGVGGMALSAVDCALWDLKARLLELPLHRLLGAVHKSAPVYGSGGFTTYDDDQLIDQLTRWVHHEHIPRVKIKIGESWGTCEVRDLRRVALTREVVGDATELYVDANGGYSVGQATRVAGRLDEMDVRWFEEPVSSDDLVGLKHVRDRCVADVTAGEYGWDLATSQRMCAAGAVDCLQVDVTRCGGITELLRIAAIAASQGLDISGHCAPQLHVAALTAVPNLRHLEWFHDHVRIETMLFDGTLQPSQGALYPVEDRTGHGLQLRRDEAEPYRVA